MEKCLRLLYLYSRFTSLQRLHERTPLKEQSLLSSFLHLPLILDLFPPGFNCNHPTESAFVKTMVCFLFLVLLDCSTILDIVGHFLLSETLYSLGCQGNIHFSFSLSHGLWFLCPPLKGWVPSSTLISLILSEMRRTSFTFLLPP